jgi:peroxiredoxin
MVVTAGDQVRKVMSMGILTGQAALPFILSDSAGKRHRLEDYRGHWLLLVFHRHLG